ncbi:MAG: hypothetical protein U9N04_02645 [Patescibacteria group bacterium]|nr:hypothetical protein [Patescibacteria group bacterium]
MRNMKMLGIAVVVAFVCAQMVCAAGPLLIKVSCQGCSNEVDIPDGYKFYADAGKSITLTVSSSGGSGDKSYRWIESGAVVCNRASFQSIVAEDDVEYVLVVTDDGGSRSKIIKISPIQESKCLPSFRRGINLRDQTRDRVEYSVGDSFTVEARLDTRDCPDSNYQFCWVADDENIIFAKPNSTKTEVRIGQGTRNGKVEIEARITNPSVKFVRSRDIEIKIVGNTPPSEVRIAVHDEPVSYTDFEICCVSFKTGERGNEHKDFIRKCSATLKDETGNIIDRASRMVAKDREIPCLRLRPEGVGIYFVEYTVEDSHGLTSTVNEPIEVNKGNTGKDVPVIDTPDTINCVVGEVCKIKTVSRGNRDNATATGFEYWLMHEGKKTERLSSSISGGFCSGPECSQVFEYPGTYTIMIEGRYFEGNNRRESKIGSGIVTVIVSSNVSATPMSTPVLTPAMTLTSVVRPTVVFVENATKKIARPEKSGWESFFSWMAREFKNALSL